MQSFSSWVENNMHRWSAQNKTRNMSNMQLEQYGYPLVDVIWIWLQGLRTKAMRRPVFKLQNHAIFKVVTSIQKKTEMTAEQLSRIAHHCNLTCLEGCVWEIHLYLEMSRIVFSFLPGQYRETHVLCWRDGEPIQISGTLGDWVPLRSAAVRCYCRAVSLETGHTHTIRYRVMNFNIKTDTKTHIHMQLYLKLL